MISTTLGFSLGPAHSKLNLINLAPLRFKFRNLSPSGLSNPNRTLTRTYVPRSYPNLNRIQRCGHHIRARLNPIERNEEPSRAMEIVSPLPPGPSSTPTVSGDDLAQPANQLEFRHLMRQLSYPVTILTTRLDSNEAHGATISSFTSICIEPEPLVSVSIRLPSRSADYLSRRSDQPFSIYCLESSPESIELAKTFSRPKDRLEPALFQTLDRVSIGKLECQIRNRLDFFLPPTSDNHLKSIEGTSALFIGRVIRSHLYARGSAPLMYHNQSYTTIKQDS